MAVTSITGWNSQARRGSPIEMESGMTHEQPTLAAPSEDPSASDTHSRVWHRILTASMAIPGAKVNRTTFLRSQLQNYCTEQQVQNASDIRPAQAGVSHDLVDKLADSCIKGHVIKASGISFAAGLPGGWFMAATIPADVGQYFWHAIVLAQKLAYLATISKLIRVYFHPHPSPLP